METKFNYGDKVLVPMNVDSVVIDDGGVTYRVSRSRISGAGAMYGSVKETELTKDEKHSEQNLPSILDFGFDRIHYMKGHDPISQEMQAFYDGAFVFRKEVVFGSNLREEITVKKVGKDISDYEIVHYIYDKNYVTPQQAEMAGKEVSIINTVSYSMMSALFNFIYYTNNIGCYKEVS